MAGMSALLESPLLQPGFWQQPLADRMAKIAELREEGPFHPAEFENPMSGGVERFYAVAPDGSLIKSSATASASSATTAPAMSTSGY